MHEKKPHTVYTNSLIPHSDISELERTKYLYETFPDNLTYHWEYAKLLKNMGKEVEAFNQYNSLMQRKGNIPLQVIEEWCSLMIQFRFIKEARSTLAKLYKANSHSLVLGKLHAYLCEKDMDDRASLESLEKIYINFPEEADILLTMSILYRRVGNTVKAEEFMEKAFIKTPFSPVLLYEKSRLHTFLSQEDTLLKNIHNALENTQNICDIDQAYLHFSLAKAYDDIGDLKEAFEHYKKGGMYFEKGRGEQEYESIKRQLVRAKTVLTKPYIENHSKTGYPSKKPIFIVGMPRSGTTLIEQVLVSLGTKGEIFGAGELEYIPDVLNQMDMEHFTLDFGKRKSYISNNVLPKSFQRGEAYVHLVEALGAKEARYFIDKTPINFVWLGYIHLILPHAKIIHSMRNPIETCLSAYRILFPEGQYWSYDLKTIGKFYRLYVELMEHWRNVLPDHTILEVKYEDMVNDLETESKRLAEHIHIEWSSSCLEFYKGKRTVRTASLSQVRNPIYKSSINRWHRYEPYLKPLLDEIGDLLQAYEN